MAKTTAHLEWVQIASFFLLGQNVFLEKLGQKHMKWSPKSSYVVSKRSQFTLTIHPFIHPFIHWLMNCWHLLAERRQIIDHGWWWWVPKCLMVTQFSIEMSLNCYDLVFPKTRNNNNNIWSFYRFSSIYFQRIEFIFYDSWPTFLNWP